jgi:hypothetical protein
MNKLKAAWATALAAGLASVACTTEGGAQHVHPSGHAAVPDTRQLVPYPDALRIHTLTNMRDHLQALGEIQAALAVGALDQASDLAESRLGMSSLATHGAHEVATFMPPGMQAAGTAMHRAASRFALVAKDASATGDIKPALQALSGLTQSCVACHAVYRLQ